MTKFEWLYGLLCSVLITSASLAFGESKSSVFTVRDSVEMTRLADPHADWQRINGITFNYSPDRRHFVLVAKRGDLKTGHTEYQLKLYDVAKVQEFVNNESAQAVLPGRVVAKFSSASSRRAIDQVKWLDNKTLAFLSENRQGNSRIYTLDLTRGYLQEELTHRNRIMLYDLKQPGGKVVFLAASEQQRTSEQKQRGYVFSGLDLTEVEELYSFSRYFVKQSSGKVSVLDWPAEQLLSSPIVSISPDEKWIVLARRQEQIPEAWLNYDWGNLTGMIQATYKKGISPPWLQQLYLVNLQSYKAKPLINSPVDFRSKLTWLENGRSVVVSQLFLPPEKAKGQPQLAGRKATLKINLQSGEVAVAPDEQLVTAFDPGVGEDQISLSVQQDLNTPADILAADKETGKSRLITSLNPRFHHLNLGKLETFTWQSGDWSWKGGLLYPPNYQKGRRYPLVVQTHGYNDSEFLVDGPDGMTAALAARALAGRGFVVLQAPDSPIEGRNVVGTADEAEVLSASYVAAIRQLDQLGVIDPSRVGITGFSRTGFYVQHALAFSGFPFAAAVVADASDFGWSSYMMGFGLGGFQNDYETMLSGIPVGDGLKNWLERNPIFHLDKVHAALRIESHQFESWLDTYVLLKKMNRPAEMVVLPEAYHSPERPWERYASQQGAVDWYVFWLMGEEDSDPVKAEQYQRWRKLRDQRQATLAEQ